MTDLAESDSPQELAKRVLVRVAEELKVDKKRSAARHFLAAIGHESIAGELGNVGWVKGVVGEDSLKALVSALSSAPCFGCKLGYEECDHCGGSGFTAVGQVCKTCAGCGKARCDFCNGSGLATYNMIPPDFRAHVMTRRVARAISLIEKLQQSDDGAHEDDRDLILRLNKLLGVLENAIIAARTLIKERRAEQSTFTALAKRISKATRSAESLLRAALHRLAQASSAPVQDENEVDRANREAAAAFYSSLVESPHFEGGGLEHFFLHPHRRGATARIQDQASAAAASTEADESELPMDDSASSAGVLEDEGENTAEDEKQQD